MGGGGRTERYDNIICVMTPCEKKKKSEKKSLKRTKIRARYCIIAKRIIYNVARTSWCYFSIPLRILLFSPFSNPIRSAVHIAE